jgi:hypothetical protein
MVACDTFSRFNIDAFTANEQSETAVREAFVMGFSRQFIIKRDSVQCRIGAVSN